MVPVPGFAFHARPAALENAGDSAPAASLNAGANGRAALENCGDGGMAERIQCVCGGAPGPSGKASCNGIVGEGDCLRAQGGGGGWTIVGS